MSEAGAEEGSDKMGKSQGGPKFFLEHWRSVGALLIGLVLGGFLVGLMTGGGEPPAESSGSASSAAAVWTCSMHPQIRQPEAGACSLCGMDLIPQSEHADNLSKDRVVLSKRARALAKLRTTRVVSRPGATKTLHFMGRFEPDQSTVISITAWTEGWIEQMNVDLVGEKVVLGDTLAKIYNPDIFEAHQELLAALRDLDGKARKGAKYRRAALAAKKRLRALGASDEELRDMEEAQWANRLVSVLAPATGTITRQFLTVGARVAPGTPVFQMTNLSSMWLQLDVHESDLKFLARGHYVEVKVAALPTEIFVGHITHIDPTIHETRRTAQVRVHFANRERLLRPGQYARAKVIPPQVEGKRGELVIPASAPLFAGGRALVFVEKLLDGEYSYEARTVRLGSRYDDVYAVTAGLQAGEWVVTEGAFALDADLQIRGAKSLMTLDDDRRQDPRIELLVLTKEQRDSLRSVLDAYLQIQAKLGGDSLEQAQDAADFLLRSVQEVKLHGHAKAQAAWELSKTILVEHATKIKKTRKIEAARVSFERLSRAMIHLLVRHGNPLPYKVRLAFCPMAFGDAGGYWMQSGDLVINPYFGAKMLHCGDILQRLAGGDYLMPPDDLESTGPRQAHASGAHSSGGSPGAGMKHGGGHGPHAGMKHGGGHGPHAGMKHGDGHGPEGGKKEMKHGGGHGPEGEKKGMKHGPGNGPEGEKKGMKHGPGNGPEGEKKGMKHGAGHGPKGGMKEMKKGGKPGSKGGMKHGAGAGPHGGMKQGGEPAPKGGMKEMKHGAGAKPAKEHPMPAGHGEAK